MKTDSLKRQQRIRSCLILHKAWWARKYQEIYSRAFCETSKKWAASNMSSYLKLGKVNIQKSNTAFYTLHPKKIFVDAFNYRINFLLNSVARGISCKLHLKV